MPPDFLGCSPSYSVNTSGTGGCSACSRIFAYLIIVRAFGPCGQPECWTPEAFPRDLCHSLLDVRCVTGSAGVLTRHTSPRFIAKIMCP